LENGCQLTANSPANLPAPQDLYGNKDPPAAALALDHTAAAAAQLKVRSQGSAHSPPPAPTPRDPLRVAPQRLPEPFRSFYARRAARELLALAGPGPSGAGQRRAGGHDGPDDGAAPASDDALLPRAAPYTEEIAYPGQPAGDAAGGAGLAVEAASEGEGERAPPVLSPVELARRALQAAALGDGAAAVALEAQ
jgi:hypothetical protein